MVRHSHAVDRSGRDRARPNSGSPDAPVSRRTVLGAGVACGLCALAGCAGGGGSAPAPVALDGSDTCDVCGMVIPAHPGPSSEIFYASREPNGHANPARFDSTWEAFEFDFAREEWTREAFYVTDYSSVAYDIRVDAGQKLISRHVGAEAFVDAESVSFVAGSSVVGTMGEDLIGFSSRADAESFQDDHGGDITTFSAVTPTTISQLGT